MKLETAIKYCHEIHRRLKEVNGRIPTPGCQYEFMQVKAIWVFGSTIKGSLSPNDLDILIQWRGAGKTFTWEEVGYDKRFYKSCGIRCTPSSSWSAAKWMTKGMKGVSRHDTREDGVKPDVKYLLYPRFEAIFPGESHETFQIPHRPPSLQWRQSPS